MSFQRSAVARWIASRVPSSVGIGCAARSSTIASISTSCSDAINWEWSPAAARPRRRPAGRATEGGPASAGTPSSREHWRRLTQASPVGQGVGLTERDAQQHGGVDVGDHRCPWRSSRSSATASTRSPAGFGSGTRFGGGVPGAGFRTRSASARAAERSLRSAYRGPVRRWSRLPGPLEDTR